MTHCTPIAQRFIQLLVALCLLAAFGLAPNSARAELLVPSQCMAAEDEQKSESEGEAEVDPEVILEEEPECD